MDSDYLVCILNLGFPLTSCLTLGKSLNLFHALASTDLKWEYNSIYLIWLLRELHALTQIMFFEWCQTREKVFKKWGNMSYNLLFIVIHSVLLNIINVYTFFLPSARSLCWFLTLNVQSSSSFNWFGKCLLSPYYMSHIMLGTEAIIVERAGNVLALVQLKTETVLDNTQINSWTA